jgi:hypothetical protein
MNEHENVMNEIESENEGENRRNEISVRAEKKSSFRIVFVIRNSLFAQIFFVPSSTLFKAISSKSLFFKKNISV